MRKIILTGLFISVLFANTEAKIKIFTEHYPPYNMRVDDKLTGSSTEILVAMFKQMKSKMTLDNVKLTNWSRGYSIALKKKNTMIYSTTRTKSREKLFKWVGPIAETSVGLIALKSKHIKINSVKELNNYKIGAVLKDVGELLLFDNGVNKENIQYVKGEKAINTSFKKMKKGRIDMFSYNTTVAFDNAKNEGFKPSKYEVVYTLSKSQLYFAFNKDTDDAIIKRWQKALDTIKSNGTYKKIIDKYLK